MPLYKTTNTRILINKYNIFKYLTIELINKPLKIS